MDISGIQGAGGFGLEALGGGSKGTSGADGGFGDLLSSLMNGLEGTQARADDALQSLAIGGEADLHEVVLATEMEAMAFQLALQVRNQVVETVQTVMNMQV